MDNNKKDFNDQLVMAHTKHHKHLLKELADQMERVLTHSPQSIYLYLDDTHKICNQKFADLLGYSSITDWVNNNTPISDVNEKDQPKVIQAYTQASEYFKASVVYAAWLKKDGGLIDTKIIMVPITYGNEVFVLHFISVEK